ncbi:DUF2304 domain-containing protein [Melittangium boletus]|uniref:DUF2304 domain-containing protein n=1 Tax=Melittangium boletus DSM 14713 TaxID=1294270 RepID=A0A250I9A4_9BACT|nr:DUF2304 domain-containing protein [Melittangium boletus]ATB28449.1 hypothetical protein MEBOL_001896 [Melittangium boletus DSM 14713]
MIGEHLLPLRLQLFGGALLLAFVIWVLRLIRHHQLSLRDSLSWLLSTLLALVCVIFPQSLRWLADLLQVEVAANALFALAFLYVLFNLLSVTIALSSGAIRVRRLSQECAMLRAEIESLRKSVGVARREEGS